MPLSPSSFLESFVEVHLFCFLQNPAEESDDGADDESEEKEGRKKKHKKKKKKHKSRFVYMYSESNNYRCES
jgi:hypothetical protein